MAVTKILARHARLDLAINYAVNPDKTDEEVLTAYLNCDKGHACRQMLATKEAKNNRDGVQYYHIIQSFKPGEITPELALEIAQAFAKEHLANYEVVIGVHVDKEHIHAHMIFNSVNQVTGRKYHSNAKSYYQQIRTISDMLCREHGLSVIMEGKPSKAVSYIEWLRQSKGQPTFRSMLEADLRDAIADANDLGHFFLLMEHKGYEIHHGNRLGFRLRGQERFMYPERKNAAFSEENIERAIAGNLAEIEAGTRPAFLPRPKPQPYRPHPKYKGFLALYYHYCYLLGRIEKRQYPPRMTPHLRREIMKAETYKARLKFLQENGISTADDLTTCMQRAENAVTQLAKQRTILNVRKKKRKKLFDALAAEESLAVSKALYEEGLSGMESEYAQYAEAKAILDTCGVSRQALTEEKADILFAGEDTGTEIKIPDAVATLNGEFTDEIYRIMEDHPYDELDMQEGMEAAMLQNWRNVLAVYAVKVSTDEEHGLDVMTMDEEKLQLLREIFFDANKLEYELTTRTVDGEQITTLHISAQIRDAMQMADEYGFTAQQREMLEELLKPDCDDIFLSLIGNYQPGGTPIGPVDISDIQGTLPDDLDPLRETIVLTAYQLLGKVTYFWGGKSLVLGWDSRWGTPTTVTAPGSGSTGKVLPFGLDCSGFVDWTFYNATSGAYLPGRGGGAASQHGYCTNIAWSDALPGDLVFYADDSHVGIVCGYDSVGNILVIHCSGGQNGVVVTGREGFAVAARPDLFTD